MLFSVHLFQRQFPILVAISVFMLAMHAVSRNIPATPSAKFNKNYLNLSNFYLI